MKIFNGKDDKIALQSCDHSYTYYDLNRYSKFLSKILTSNFIYGIAARNDINTVLIYLSLLYNDCSFLIFDPSIINDKNAFIYSIGLDKIICSEDLNELDQSKYSKEIISKHNLKICLYKEKTKKETVKVRHPSILLNTSGSSGTPKIVRINYGNLLSNTKGIIKSLALSSTDKSISTLPLFYTYGLSILNTHMFTGGTFYITNNSILQKPFFEEISNFEPTMFSGVPSTFQILKRMSYSHIKQPFIKKITQAGGALDLKIQSEVLEICSSKKEFYIMYGQTEATARITCFNLCSFPNKIGSVGLPLNNISVKINDPDIDTKIGKISVTGPSITQGYIINCTELSNNPLIKTLDTGDLGYIDDDGFLFITGRSSRFCKINGKRYNLDVIEKEFNSLNLKKINAVSDDKYLYLFSNEKISKHSIKISGIHPTLIKIIILDNIPLKANGKINYHQLLEIAENTFK